MFYSVKLILPAAFSFLEVSMDEYVIASLNQNIEPSFAANMTPVSIY